MSEIITNAAVELAPAATPMMDLCRATGENSVSNQMKYFGKKLTLSVNKKTKLEDLKEFRDAVKARMADCEKYKSNLNTLLQEVNATLAEQDFDSGMEWFQNLSPEQKAKALALMQGQN